MAAFGASCRSETGPNSCWCRPSSSALADLDRLYAQFTSSDSEDQELSLRDRLTGVQGLEPQTGRQSGCEEVREASFSWEKLLGEAASQTRDSHLPAESFYQVKLASLLAGETG